MSNEERTFTLTLKESVLNYIGSALVKQPYAEVSGMLNDIQAQVNEQMKPPVEEPGEKIEE